MHEYILSNDEAIRLKKYIEQKHKDYDRKQQLSIWSDAVHRIIEGRLPSFSDEVKTRLRAELLVKHQDTFVIHQDDALQQCLSLDLSKEELLGPLVEWVNGRLEVPADDQMLAEALVMRAKEANAAISLAGLAQSLEEIAASSEEVLVPVLAGMETPPDHMHRMWPLRGRKRPLAVACLACVALLTTYAMIKSREAELPPVATVVLSDAREGNLSQAADDVSGKLRYAEVDIEKLQNFLQKRNSTLAEEPYLSSIIAAAKKYDVHPLLLFSITGQEQGFVSKDHDTAKEIANNPFNVFGSWETYNTSIEASANIAAKTVANIRSRQPEDTHPIQWLNQTYAEDPNWWKGVTWFYNAMLQEVSGESFE